MCIINISIMSKTDNKTKTYVRLTKVNPQISVNREGRFVCEGKPCFIWNNDRCKGCFISTLMERRNNRELLIDN